MFPLYVAIMKNILTIFGEFAPFISCFFLTLVV